MTEIDFYTHVEDRLRVTCQLVQKARARDLGVMVLLPDEARLRAFDERLWSFQPASFIPHCRVDAAVAAETPVLLSCDPGQLPLRDDLLVNLCDVVPLHFAQFRRVLEVVSTLDHDREQARNRFKTYREGGFTLRTHDLSGTPATREVRSAEAPSDPRGSPPQRDPGGMTAPGTHGGGET